MIAIEAVTAPDMRPPRIGGPAGSPARGTMIDRGGGEPADGCCRVDALSVGAYCRVGEHCPEAGYDQEAACCRWTGHGRTGGLSRRTLYRGPRSWMLRCGPLRDGTLGCRARAFLRHNEKTSTCCQQKGQRECAGEPTGHRPDDQLGHRIDFIDDGIRRVIGGLLKLRLFFIALEL